MTRAEFIQNAVISMAGKVIGTNGIAESGDWRNVLAEAEELADEVENHGYVFGK